MRSGNFVQLPLSADQSLAGVVGGAATDAFNFLVRVTGVVVAARAMMDFCRARGHGAKQR
jgi:hypothetical protein